MRLLTSDDITETISKAQQRGFTFIGSKFNPKGHERTLSAFDDEDYFGSNWWIIPQVKKRWNLLITGKTFLRYEDYVMQKYFAGKDVHILSLGSGVCSHEIYLAENYNVKVTCVDIATNLINKAKKFAAAKQLKNIEFFNLDINKINSADKTFDVVLFHESLHHMEDIPKTLKLVSRLLKKNGILIIHEYVGPNRLQFPDHQISAINDMLNQIPKEFKKRFQSKKYKTRVSGPGLIRMILADPSECISSSTILKNIRKRFDTLEEKAIGGNLLMLGLKDIAHNFVDETIKSNQILYTLFDMEDKYLEKYKSDFVFGVYKKKGR